MSTVHYLDIKLLCIFKKWMNFFKNIILFLLLSDQFKIYTVHLPQIRKYQSLFQLSWDILPVSIPFKTTFIFFQKHFIKLKHFSDFFSLLFWHFYCFLDYVTLTNYLISCEICFKFLVQKKKKKILFWLLKINRWSLLNLKMQHILSINIFFFIYWCLYTWYSS